MHTDLTYQHNSLRSQLTLKFEEHVANNDFIRGKAVSQFESEFRDYLGAGNVIGVANGTDALELCLEALQLDKGAVVAIPANSFVASAEAVVRSGLTPVFVDVDESMNMSIDSLRGLRVKPSAAVVVHLYGVPAPIDQIVTYCESEGITVVEDCAQAHGAKSGGRAVGTFGKCAAFSFFPGKNLGALGDGGAVVTDDDGVAERVRRLANHGRLAKEDHLIVGRNSRLDSLQASFLSLKLARLEEWNEARRRNAATYFDELGGLPQFDLPKYNQLDSPVWHQFVIQVRPELRALLADFLSDRKIETRIVYPLPIPETPAFFGSQGEWKTAKEMASKILSLPVGEHLSQSEIQLVSKSVAEFMEVFA